MTNESAVSGQNTVIDQRVLKLIADHISGYKSHSQWSEFFIEQRIPSDFDLGGSKRDRVYSVLHYLAKTDQQLLFRVIEEFVHPLTYFGDVDSAISVEHRFNSWLGYDGLQIVNGKIEEIISSGNAIEQKPTVPKPDILAICELADNFRRVIQIIELYFRTGQPRNERLNEYYIQLCDKTDILINKCNERKLKENYLKPFSTLFSAQKELDEKNTSINCIKNILHAFYGEIQRVLIQDEGIEITETDLGEIDKYLNQLSESETIVHQNQKINEIKAEPIPLKIVEMPELKIKGFEEKVILQKPSKKAVRLRQFPPGTKWDDITIQFLNGQEVILKVKDLTFQTNHEEMGFEDERQKKPNRQWDLLQLLATKGGEISYANNNNLNLKEVDKIKKKKQLLSDCLKAYFQIDEDPFHPYKTEGAYKIKIKLIAELDSSITSDQEEF